MSEFMEEKKIFGRIHMKLLKLLSGLTVEAILEVWTNGIQVMALSTFLKIGASK